MKHSPSSCRIARFAKPSTLLSLQAIGLAIACLMASHAARAQGAAMQPSPSAATVPTAEKALPAHSAPDANAAAPSGGAAMEEPEYAPPLQVGDATQDLLTWQRSGVIASQTPRPIPGAIAYRSYERYLKSFEFPIPEHLNSSVKSSSSK